MHEMLAKIDDTTYRRIIEDARMKGVEPREWINHAVYEFLARPSPVYKEVPACENPPCPPAPVQVHAELYTPHHGDECHVIIGQLQQKVRDLETERDNLKVLLDQYKGSGSSVSGEEMEILTLNCEIDKNTLTLDAMETSLERLRLEREQLLRDPQGVHRVPQVEKQIEKQQYEVENFSEEIEKLIQARDALKKEIEKQRKT